MRSFVLRSPSRLAYVLLLAACVFSNVQRLSAADYFLTIAGGYSPTGNQASLEANVLFFQQVLQEKHPGKPVHDILFADGHDQAADLQVLAPKVTKPDLPATELLATLHRRRTEEKLEYRNHHVPHINGPLDPALIHASLEKFAKSAGAGDRVIVYVTAHGSEGREGDSFNTTIDCWNEKKITGREFTKWLGDLPVDVPVVMVMAQCYCGGFSHTIFNDLDTRKGLAPQLRIGFYAQQHNLPAAGCRPDIENDDEFSSYFWGAIAGRSRTGTPIDGCDIDGDGRISFSEAYAYAVVAGNTIDIPLRASDALLRQYSRLKEKVEPKKVDSESESDQEEKGDASESKDEAPVGPKLSTMTGPVQSLVDSSRPSSVSIVTLICKELGLSIEDDVSAVVASLERHRREGRKPFRGGPGGQGRGRGGSGRRQLLQEITEKWPELGDPRKWEESDLLRDQETLVAELKALPGWKVYDDRRKQQEEAGKQTQQHELREVKFRRLISTLETIVLEKNLSLVATADIVERYRKMIALEDSHFAGAK